TVTMETAPPSLGAAVENSGSTEGRRRSVKAVPVRV
ncbi:hypothetical protein QTP86_006998, partial [Hemibagrus guttatus]